MLKQTQPMQQSLPRTPQKLLTTAPIEDPTVDYSEFGKYGFENLLPKPLPFSNEEADWHSRKIGPHGYEVVNRKKLKNPEDLVNIIQEYVTSFESYGYTVTSDQTIFNVFLEKEKIVRINCDTGYLHILISDLSHT